MSSHSPTISYHLTDREKTPVTTSAASQPQFDSLTSLAATALTTLSAASRLGLGTPERVVVEHAGGRVVLCSFLDPAATAADEDDGRAQGQLPSVARHRDGMRAAEQQQRQQAREARGDEEDVPELPPMLISVVVGAGEEDMAEARRTAGMLERMGRGVQREWLAGGGRESDGEGFA